MAGVGEHMDSWGKTTEGCEVSIDHPNHGSWHLCGKPPVAIGLYGENGSRGVRRICAHHRAGALRKTTFWADDITEIQTPEGGTTHMLERRRGRKGSLVPTGVTA